MQRHKHQVLQYHIVHSMFQAFDDFCKVCVESKIPSYYLATSFDEDYVLSANEAIKTYDQSRMEARIMSD